MKQIKRIVFTGGPCSGKTTFTSRAQTVFGQRGYRVIIDHESATDLITGGISPATMGMFEFQKYCIGLQLKKEEICYKAAQEISGDKVIIFIDRGINDDMAYVGADDFREILKDFDLVPEEINDRYDLVVHLVTSAKGKEEAYTYSNNEARYETIDMARQMDDMALEAWKDHPNRVVIGNEDIFETKMNKAIQSVFEYLGDNAPQKYDKYLVEVDENMLEKMKSEANFSISSIVQHYLKPENASERRIRVRQTGDEKMYLYSESNFLASNERIKTDRILTEREYKDYLKYIDPEINETRKQRYSFIYNDLFYKLDVYDFDTTKGILAIDYPAEYRQLPIPDYVKVIKNVTDDPSYKNYYLAKALKY